jgi:hypothetical protein
VNVFNDELALYFIDVSPTGVILCQKRNVRVDMNGDEGISVPVLN